MKWSTSAFVGAVAGAGAALARARRSRGTRMPPRVAVGVDGLGEVESEDITPVANAPQPELEGAVSESGDEASAAADDAIRALDEARERLRRRADELAREMGPGDA